MLAIREASRFVIGSAAMRERAIEASGNESITLDNVALAAVQNDEAGAKVRESIHVLADQEASWLRNTPPHVLASERVATSRGAEVETFGTMHRAVVAAIEHAPSALAGDEHSTKTLLSAFAAAFEAIDGAPGSSQERRQLLQAMRDDVTRVGGSEGAAIGNVLKAAETSYMDRRSTEILARYDRSLDQSDDFAP